MVSNPERQAASDSPARICIDARLTSGGELGGVEQFVIGLATGLSQLGDGAEEYWFLTYPDNDAWLRPYLGGSCRILQGTAATKQPGWARSLKRMTFLRAPARRFLNLFQSAEGATTLPKSDGLIETKGFDLVHFPTQSAFLTSVPSIYHPWDLQHLHLPQYFSPEAFQKRESEYRAFCAQAVMVAAATSWQKLDLIAQYQLPEDKVHVVEPAPVVDAYPTPAAADLRSIRDKFNLPARFILYPAQTWPHKNHLRLLEALALLRDRDNVVVHLVSCGKLNEFFPEIQSKTRALNLQEQVTFLGFVGPMEVQCLYRLCRGMVFPTLFEGFGMPLIEAFVVGTPTACSNVTSLPAQAGDAALLFDPHEVTEIAEAISRLWIDDALCETLADRGRERVSAFNWDRTARLFRAHYRRLIGVSLSKDDQALLSAPPLI